MIVAAVAGWAIPGDWFETIVRDAFPGATVHTLLPKDPADAQEAKALLQSVRADLYLGHSLGSLWLLTHRAFMPEKAERALLAPILAFCRERDKGGKTVETQLKYLIRVLTRSPEQRSPLLDFHVDCGVAFTASEMKSLPDSAVLLNGLKFLQTALVSADAATGFYACVGERDPFLDADRLKQLIPGLEVLPGAGHSPVPLVLRLAERWHQSGRQTP